MLYLTECRAKIKITDMLVETGINVEELLAWKLKSAHLLSSITLCYKLKQGAKHSNKMNNVIMPVSSQYRTVWNHQAWHTVP